MINESLTHALAFVVGLSIGLGGYHLVARIFADTKAEIAKLRAMVDIGEARFREAESRAKTEAEAALAEARADVERVRIEAQNLAVRAQTIIDSSKV